MKAGLALVCVVSLASCSIALDGPVKQPRPDQYPDCDEHSGAIIADFGLAVLSAVVFARAYDLYDESPGDDERNVMITSSILGATFATSGVLGVVWSGRCGRLKRRYEREHPTRPIAVPTPPAPSPTAAEGAVGGACYGNLTCNEGAFCERDTQVCRPGNRGLPGGECYPDGSCALDGECRDGRCHPPELRQCVSDQHCPLGTRCSEDGQCASP